jgi:hypothetical protein
MNTLHLFYCCCTQDANNELPKIWSDVVHIARVLSMACVLWCAACFLFCLSLLAYKTHVDVPL